MGSPVSTCCTKRTIRKVHETLGLDTEYLSEPKKRKKRSKGAPKRYNKVNRHYTGDAKAKDEQMISLCYDGKKYELERLMSRKTLRINSIGPWGCTALYAACATGQTYIAKLLILNRASVNYINEGDCTHRGFLKSIFTSGHRRASIAFGAKNLEGKLASFKMTRGSSKANLQSTGPKGVTPLFMACQSRSPEIIKVLLEARAKVNIVRTEDGVTPLYMACRQGCLKSVKLLIKYQGDTNHRVKGLNQATPLYVASELGHSSVVDHLLNKKADVNAKTLMGYTPLFVACYAVWRENQDTVVSQLISHKADTGVTVIHKLKRYTPLSVVDKQSKEKTTDIAKRNRILRVMEKLIQSEESRGSLLGQVSVRRYKKPPVSLK